MKTFMMVCCLWCCTLAQSGADWFNVMGDAADESVNTIEVDPTPVYTMGDSRVMRLRVSRSQERVNWDGVSYRSYVSEVFFDCPHDEARYLSIDYYRQPGWKGEPFLRRVYSHKEPHIVEFPDVEPNPYRRIIRAACHSSTITNN